MIAPLVRSRCVVFALIANLWPSVFCPAQSQVGQVYYVNSHGRDDHPGTSAEKAWRTIDRVKPS